MVEQIRDLYEQPSIEEYEDTHLLSLSESCAALEERVRTIAKALPEQNRLIIEEYIRTRDDLEVETVKMALRWGKRHYR